MAKIFEQFPYLENDYVIIKRMIEDDVESLEQITNNDNVYKFIPPFLYKKNRGNLLAAIRNLGGRDFEKQKMIIAGIYLKENPNKLVGLAEMFDYKKRQNQITVGYRLNESFWHKGIATNAINLMKTYLTEELGISTLKAFVIHENCYSAKALLKCGFKKEDYTEQESNWGGQETVEVEVYTFTR